MNEYNSWMANKMINIKNTFDLHTHGQKKKSDNKKLLERYKRNDNGQRMKEKEEEEE